MHTTSGGHWRRPNNIEIKSSLWCLLQTEKSIIEWLFGSKWKFRFRLHNIAVVAYTEKTYFNIGIQEDDKDALRFLWKEDSFDTTSKSKVLWFTRVCFRLVSSILHLEATIDRNLKCCLKDHPDISSDIINKIKHSLYEDGFSSGAEQLKDLSEIYIKSSTIYKILETKSSFHVIWCTTEKFNFWFSRVFC